MEYQLTSQTSMQTFYPGTPQKLLGQKKNHYIYIDNSIYYGYCTIIMTITQITDTQAEFAIKNGEFDKDILQSSENIAIILTQGWCGQWIIMRRYLKKIEKEQNDHTRGLSIFTLEYDKLSNFREFMQFKEEKLGNSMVPYIRYYKKGELTESSNFVSQGKFFSLLKIDKEI